MTLDLLVRVDTPLKDILSKVMIVVCSHLRSFVHFPHVKDSEGA